jgi:hypothetical protein
VSARIGENADKNTCLVPRMISEARETLAQIINPAAMAWLPNVREHFKLLDA